MACSSDDDCSFLFHCAQNGQCQHNSVFPLSVYTIIVYIFIPIACGLVNSTGHSMGLFKVLIVTNILRYQGIQATMVSQSLVVGTALPNYFSMLVRKHPTLPASLVNFNLVYILVPCCLLGSTLGSLITLFVPNLIQQILTFIVFSYFSWGFYKKYKKFKLKQLQLKESLISTDSQKLSDSPGKNNTQPSDINQKLHDHKQGLQNRIDCSTDKKQKQNHLSASEQKQKEEILNYQKSYHIKDILLSLFVFLVFQFVVFLVQGKLPFLEFHHCDWKYFVGLFLLIFLTTAYMTIIRQFLKKKFLTYQKFNIYQEIDLSKGKQFRLIVMAGFLAGLAQGILGVGSGSCMMSFLLMTSINASSASATTGYQVLFIGLAALIEGFINGEVNLVDSGFFMVLCIFLGGIITVLLANYLQKKDPIKVGKIVTIIAVFLSLVSVVMVVPDVVTMVINQGWTKIMKIRFSCEQ